MSIFSKIGRQLRGCAKAVLPVLSFTKISHAVAQQEGEKLLNGEGCRIYNYKINIVLYLFYLFYFKDYLRMQ